MARLVAVVFLCLIAFPAQAHQFSCDEVRSYVAQHGKAKALAAAIKHGATWREVYEARKCLQPNKR